jgi:uncharacterized glyoxalase superfamily protein PhnB
MLDRLIGRLEETMYAVEKVELILTVPSIEETAAWYERALGWDSGYDAYDQEGRCTFGSVARDQVAWQGINLSRAPAGPYSNEGSNLTVFIKVDDVDAVYGRVIDSGVTPDAELEDQPWGGRTFSLRDLNGFHLTIWQEL